MNLLHTSDWHLGRYLHGRKRYEEFAVFLDWLYNAIEREKVDALLVAGDIFDTSTPSNKAQELYYNFLCRIAASCCRNVVIIAGNHDSPSFLNAPKELLRVLNVHVIGAMTENLADEVIPIVNFKNGILDLEKSAIICAVPYLRDKDILIVEAGETIDDKNKKLAANIKTHYAEVVKLAEQKRAELISQAADENHKNQIPIIAMGHLYMQGGKLVDGDEVRELYIGSLVCINKELFSSAINYFALGHLHDPQTVSETEHIRYCGSPIPMSFGKAAQEKKVVLIEFDGVVPNIQELSVPCFQQLIAITGTLPQILAKLEELKKEASRAWLKIEYTGNDHISNSDLSERVGEALAGSFMESLGGIGNRRVMDKALNRTAENETLDDLNPNDVFIRCLEINNVALEEREELITSYNEIIKYIDEKDKNEL